MSPYTARQLIGRILAAYKSNSHQLYPKLWIPARAMVSFRAGIRSRVGCTHKTEWDNNIPYNHMQHT
jgi:hypothetical protein